MTLALVSMLAYRLTRIDRHTQAAAKELEEHRKLAAEMRRDFKK